MGGSSAKSSLLYYWNPVRAAFGRPGMDFYELRHFCATHLLELGVSHADVAMQLGHTDGGALVMSTYGHPSEDCARERLKRAYARVFTPQPRLRAAGEQTGGTRSDHRCVERSSPPVEPAASIGLVERNMDRDNRRIPR